MLSFLGWKSNDDNVDRLAETYAKGLYVMARGLSDAPGDALDQIAGRLEASLSSDQCPDLREIFAIEMELSRRLPDDVKQRRYWEYRARFERVASPAELAAYLSSNPPPPAATTAGPAGGPYAIGEADNLVLLSHVHRNYLMTVLREGAERDLKYWVQRSLGRGLIFYGFILALLLGLNGQQIIPDEAMYFATGITLLYLMGRLGAATSVVQRLQAAVREVGKDTFFEITALCTGRRGISIAMMEGGIFAILLYVVFGAGLGQNLGMAGGIFPEVARSSPANRTPEAGANAGAAPADGSARSDGNDTGLAAGGTAPAPKGNSRGDAPCPAANLSCIPSFMTELSRHLGFRDYPDFFRMLLLAFLAGFAERLVPDAIDRLVQRRTASGSEIEAALKSNTNPSPPTGDRTAPGTRPPTSQGPATAPA